MLICNFPKRDILWWRSNALYEKVWAFSCDQFDVICFSFYWGLKFSPWFTSDSPLFYYLRLFYQKGETGPRGLPGRDGDPGPMGPPGPSVSILFFFCFLKKSHTSDTIFFSLCFILNFFFLLNHIIDFSIWRFSSNWNLYDFYCIIWLTLFGSFSSKFKM